MKVRVIVSQIIMLLPIKNCRMTPRSLPFRLFTNLFMLLAWKKLQVARKICSVERIFRVLTLTHIPYENKAYFISILFLFFMLFYSYHFCIFSLFSQTILKQFFTYFKPIILKQKNSQKIVQRIYQNLVNQLKNSVKIALK